MSSSPALTDPHGISRRDLVDGDGLAYLTLRAQLEPRWVRLWVTLILGHLALAGTLAGVVVMSGRSVVVDASVAVVGAIAVGFTVHYLVLFQHEAAHGNLAPERRVNDLLCDLLIGPLIGESVASYRVVHFAHHRHLGTVRDTERTYFEAFGVRFVVQGLSGIRVLRVLRSRSTTVGAADDEQGRRISRVLPLSLLLHVGVLGAALLAGYPTVAVAWVLGVVAVFPFVNATRQLLEHRDEAADRAVDYATIDHGAVHRTFGSGPLASTLGGAGFNRHFLHHWDPGVSCTRLADLERYLLDTPFAESVSARRTTYVATARRLFSS